MPAVPGACSSVGACLHRHDSPPSVKGPAQQPLQAPLLHSLLQIRQQLAALLQQPCLLTSCLLQRSELGMYKVERAVCPAAPLSRDWVQAAAQLMHMQSCVIEASVMMQGTAV